MWAIACGVVVFVRSIPAVAAQSTQHLKHVNPEAQIEIRCDLPGAAPLIKAPITITATRKHAPWAGTAVTAILTDPRGLTNNLTPRRLQEGAFVAETDFTEAGVYRLTVKLQKGEMVHNAAFQWMVESFDAPRITPSELKRLRDRGEVVVVDVQSDAKEYIEGALLIPTHHLEENIGRLPKDKMIATYCACKSEHSAALVTQRLLDLGYRSAAIYGGLTALKESGWKTKTLP